MILSQPHSDRFLQLIYDWNLQMLSRDKTPTSAPPQIIYLFISLRIYEVCDQTQPGCLSLVRALLGKSPGNQVDPGTKIIQNVAMAILPFLRVKF